jgi:radical SAM protein with 4Fe4S-binding SPASM domain|tara:strand:- start:265 stop:1119 length:855 start_codon:yes stop_codon:yes gene_type:complete
VNKTTKYNIKRKSLFLDEVVLHKGVPLFSFIDINPTELCNRTCIFCPRHDPKIYPNQDLHMELNVAHKIREQLEELNWNGSINICGNGEPLLHKDITGLVGAFGKNIHTEIVTNGDKLSVELIDELFENGLDYLIVSMYDGPEQVDYFNNMFNNSKIDKSRYLLRDRWYSEEEGYGIVLTNRAGTFDFKNNEKQKNPCFYMHYSLQIDWNGDVLFCIQDVYGKTRRFGNVKDDLLIDVWKSRQMDKFRKLLGNGNRTESPCDNCDAIGVVHGHSHFLKWEKIYE